MQAHHSSPKTSYRSCTPPLDSSSEDLCIDYDLDDLEKIEELPRKPHFLDYDYIPPPDYEDSVEGAKKNAPRSGEHIKIDKKYELDGEISDCVLSNSSDGNPKRDKSGRSNVLSGASNPVKINLGSPSNYTQRSFLTEFDNLNTGTKRKKHFLEESAMSPVYNREREREHRSLDRNFERLGENINLKYERKLSLDRDGSASVFVPKTFERDTSPVYHRGTWPSDKPNDIQTFYSHIQSNEISKLGPKFECVYSLLSMLGSNDSNEMSMKFLDLSKSPETCVALRRSGCIPLLVQMMHSDSDDTARKRAALALHNVVHCHPDDKVGRREAKVLRLIEQIMDYNDFLKNFLKIGESICDDLERHPSQAIYSLMKISFDEDHRHAMCQLGALPAVANLVYLDHAAHGSKSNETRCITLRRYSGMALTNLTFGDGNNKALLCSNKNFMKSLVNQLDSSPEELIQVTACVLRNLSWRADNNMKSILTEIGTVTALTKAAMKNKNENTLKSILSALWNLTAHCSMNKAELCNVEGALAFLADMLVYEAPGKNLAIVENAGGILRNVSSHIAVREDYRKILRQRNCLGILLQQLKSESLTVVSNACGTLWNLSARCPEDQKFLCDNGAVPMLRSLVHSKHKMISNGSNAALKNLLNFKPTGLNTNSLDPIAKSMNLKELPSLNMRKQRALEEDLDQNLSETCENIDVVTPPKEEQNVQDFCNVEQNFHHHKANKFLARTSIPKSDSREFSTVKSLNENIINKEIIEPVQSTSKKLNQTKSETKTLLKYSDETGDLCDQLTDFSIKYNREPAVVQKPTDEKLTAEPKQTEPSTFTVYQETDLDQITDYSLRYAEKHNESEDKSNRTSSNARVYGNEIILSLDDTVKCYETEGTPYTISNATSMSDLRNNKETDKLIEKQKPKTVEVFSTNSGIDTPEKPVNYCEEGTPGYFSRRDSISSIEETNCLPKTKLIQKTSSIPVDIPETAEENDSCGGATAILATTPGGSSTSKNVTFVDFEQETPLMFSRHSSVESLSSAEPDCADDRSSIVSDFSRLASGIISPSELPDSPTQSMPQTPRTAAETNISRAPISVPPPLRSVFEDETNSFGVENTPAQFSCATSLSNLSLDDEPKISSDSLTKDMRLMNHPSEEQEELAQANLPECEQNGRTIEGNNSNEDSLRVEDIESKENDVDSDGEESTNDDILLATCINIGMNRGTRPKPPLDVSNQQTSNTTVNYTNDDVTKYCTEGTPAILSKAGSNTNLSILSLETNKADLSDDSSNTSDVGNDRLFEECIRDGMKKSQSKEFNDKMYKENPIAMMRNSGMLPPYLLDKDETNKFNVEDSPCNFSTMSALSNLTIDSEGGAACSLAQASKPPVKQVPLKERRETQLKNQSGDESLSSISIDSEDDNNLLNQAIAAGFESKPKYNSANRMPSTTIQTSNQQQQASSSNLSKINVQKLNDATNKMNKFSISSNQLTHHHEANDSLSSVDSCESNENQQNSLFEQCIRSGMHKDAPKPKQIDSPDGKTSSSPKKSFLPMYRTASDRERDRLKEREKKDEQLFLECINTGISKSIRKDSQVQSQSIRVLSASNRRVTTSEMQNMDVKIVPSSNFSKNGQATSVVVSDLTSAPSTTTDVGMELHEGTKGLKNEIFHHNTILMKQNGCNGGTKKLDKSNLLETSNTSINLFLNSSDLLERSNEYPALKISNTDFNEESLNSSMEMSNEFLIENSDSAGGNISTRDKHKDPDLMLKSVERLTHELVSTAEFLRTNVSNNDEDSSMFSQDKKSSNSNNTWNEDTCPNDVSFPSISMTAPMIASMNEDDTYSDGNPSKSWVLEEATPTNEYKRFPEPANIVIDEFLREASLDTTLTFDVPKQNSDNGNDFESLEPESNTLTTEYYDEKPNIGIHFDVGGEVKPLITNKNIMTTSIIAQEAHRIVNDLKIFSHMTESATSLDLDNIRPPSAMENLSISGYFETPNSPILSRNRKKSLPAGLLARRAIGNFQNGGSLESVHSSCNLDNIKPPSLMDELLDSMISVASITSELADSTLDGNSLYDTALSDIDDTMTLQSCLDIPHDRTPIPSDFSSTESTPKKSSRSRRSLTPKQKRQLVKDRYRTYTIAADMVLKEKLEEVRNEQSSNVENTMEEVISIEFDEVKQKTTPKQRRQENRSRFQTQVLDSSGVGSSSSIETNYNDQIPEIIDYSNYNNDDDDDDASIKALTEQFKFINRNINKTSTTEITTTILAKEIHPYVEADIKSIDFEQNSETESCEQNEISDQSGDFRTFTRPTPKIIKPDEIKSETPDQQPSPVPEVKAIRGGKKAAYISPYRRTTAVNGASRTTSPKNSSTSSSRTNLATKTTNDVKKSLKTTNVSNLIPRNQTVVNKTHVVINKTNLTNRINAIKTKTTIASKQNGIPKPSTKGVITGSTTGCSNNVKKDLVEIPQMPDRQGTFVKDQPTNDDVPVVTSNPTSPSKIPKLPSKIGSTQIPKVTTPKSPGKTFISKLKNPITKSTSMDADKIAAAQKKNTPIANIKVSTPTSGGGDTQKRRSLGVFKSPSVPSVPQRSNSNTSMQNNKLNNNLNNRKSIPSTTPPSRSNSKTNITSKIAGLWKKSDEIKKDGKKNNQTIPASSTTTTKLIRSSTFDNTPADRKLLSNVQPKSCNNNKQTFTSKISQIASKYRQEPSTSAQQQGVKYTKSTSTNNIKNLLRNSEASSSTSNNINNGDVKAKRISRIGTFINGETDDVTSN